MRTQRWKKRMRREWIRRFVKNRDVENKCEEGRKPIVARSVIDGRKAE